MVREADKYTYRVMWSDEDEEFVGLCAELPSLSWLAALIGGLPQVFVRNSPQNSGVLVLGSTAIRMVVTLGGVLIIALGTDVARVSFLLWVALSYFVFLGADVFYVLRPKPSE